MIITTKKYKNIRDCYAFKTLPQELAEKFIGSTMDIEYHGNDISQISNADSCCQIPMAKQDEYVKQWIHTHLKQKAETYYGYVVVADWEISLEGEQNTLDNLWKSMNFDLAMDFLYNRQEMGILNNRQTAHIGVAQFRIEHFGNAMDFAKSKNAVLLAGRKSEVSIEEFKSMFYTKDRFLVQDEEEVFQWVNREDGMYVMYTSDSEGERISIFEKE